MEVSSKIASGSTTWETLVACCLVLLSGMKIESTCEQLLVNLHL